MCLLVYVFTCGYFGFDFVFCMSYFANCYVYYFSWIRLAGCLCLSSCVMVSMFAINILCLVLLLGVLLYCWVFVFPDVCRLVYVVLSWIIASLEWSWFVDCRFCRSVGYLCFFNGLNLFLAFRWWSCFVVYLNLIDCCLFGLWVWYRLVFKFACLFILFVTLWCGVFGVLIFIGLVVLIVTLFCFVWVAVMLFYELFDVRLVGICFSLGCFMFVYRFNFW